MNEREQGRIFLAASKEAAQIVSRHALPLAIKPRRSDLPWGKMDRGTFSLVNAGLRDVFVTCHHVLEGLQEARRRDDAALLVAYAGLIVDGQLKLAEYNTFELFDESESLDVAIFRGQLNKMLPSDLPNHRFIDYPASYLEDPKVGEPVMLVGYPAANISIDPQLTDCGSMQIIYPVSSVSDRYVVLADEDGTRHFTDYDTPARKGVSLGGLSGSPAFILREERLRFIGVVSESGDSGTTENTIFVSRLGCLKSDGKLDHHRIPA